MHWPVAYLSVSHYCHSGYQMGLLTWWSRSCVCNPDRLSTRTLLVFPVVVAVHSLKSPDSLWLLKHITWETCPKCLRPVWTETQVLSKEGFVCKEFTVSLMSHRTWLCTMSSPSAIPWPFTDASMVWHGRKHRPAWTSLLTSWIYLRGTVLFEISGKTSCRGTLFIIKRHGQFVTELL